MALKHIRKEHIQLSRTVLLEFNEVSQISFARKSFRRFFFRPVNFFVRLSSSARLSRLSLRGAWRFKAVQHLDIPKHILPAIKFCVRLIHSAEIHLCSRALTSPTGSAEICHQSSVTGVHCKLDLVSKGTLPLLQSSLRPSPITTYCLSLVTSIIAGGSGVSDVITSRLSIGALCAYVAMSQTQTVQHYT